ncbi:hypothetical protein [Jiella pacifica]|uniref:Uncharacterized protein n=1 Tax=Jiella pacifica TaxID=2696469 RepID=A0A6N9T947_9HYPH|nr:hypothetical protein [Jiella pacifica]NDW07810.1 hypothetical protein [Jiella pacifica]
MSAVKTFSTEEFFDAYRASLQASFSCPQNGPKCDAKALQDINAKLDEIESSGKLSNMQVEDIVEEIKAVNNQENIVLFSIGRDLCIAAWVVVGAAVVAAWVASGGTLLVGTAVAGVQVSSKVLAALAGGASGATIACILGNCGRC